MTTGKQKVEDLYKTVMPILLSVIGAFLFRLMMQFERVQEDQEKLKIDVAVVIQISKENQINLRNLMMFENEKQRRIEHENNGN